MKIILFANTDWYLFNFRLSLAKALRDSGNEVVLVSPPGPYGQNLRELGFKWLSAPMDRRSLNPLREVRLLIWLRRLLLKERVDIVHGFTIKCAIYGSLAALAARRRRYLPRRVNAVAGLGYVFTSVDKKARVLRPLVRILFRLALGGSTARLVLQNSDDAEFFRTARLVDSRRVRLIPGSGVDCFRFSPPLNDPIKASERFQVVLPARLIWDKGVAEFVEAARLLHSEGRPIDFVLAGEPDYGNPASVPASTISGWEEEGLVKWVGHVHDMPALFTNVDLVVLPSYREGLPKGLIEAGACGLAVITCDVPGCREVVTNGVDGILVAPRDPVQLARAIAYMHDNPHRRRKFGEALRVKVLRQFDERIVISRTMDVYQELLGGSGQQVR